MKFTALKNSISSGASPIYLFEGEEGYFRDKGVQMLKDAFVNEPSLNFTSFDGNFKGNFKELISSANSYPFMSEKRLVKISELYIGEKDYEKISELFEKPASDTIIAIVNSGKAKAGGCDLKKKPNVMYVDCSSASEEDVLKWIFVTFKRAGVYADASVCAKISSYCCGSITRVSKEVEKLISYAGENGKITDEDVENCVYKDADYKIYELTNAVARKDYSKFLSVEKELSAKGFDEMSFLSVLGSYYKNLYDMGISPLSDREAAQAFSVKEYAVKKNREQAAATGINKVKYFCGVFYGAVADIKCGNLSPSSALKAATAKIFFNDA